MIVVSRGAYNQVHDIITWYCDSHTPQEYGRSAFWVWIDKIHAEVNNVSLRKAKKLKSGEYVYRMQYWGKIFFSAKRLRIKGKFAGTLITITGFQFDEENFYNWLTHQSTIERKEPLPTNKPSKRCKPIDIKMGFTKVKSQSGLWAIADSSGNIISEEWFQDVSYVRKTATGELATIVNKDGWAFAFYPSRDKGHRLVNMNATYNSIITESKINGIINEIVYRFMSQKILNESIRNNTVIPLNENDLRQIIAETLHKVIPMYVPIKHNSILTLDTGSKTKSLVTISDGAGRYDIGEDDGCYVIYKNRKKLEPMYIFPELHKELKRLPELPLN